MIFFSSSSRAGSLLLVFRVDRLIEAQEIRTRKKSVWFEVAMIGTGGFLTNLDCLTNYLRHTLLFSINNHLLKKFFNCSWRTRCTSRQSLSRIILTKRMSCSISSCQFWWWFPWFDEVDEANSRWRCWWRWLHWVTEDSLYSLYSCCSTSDL